MNAQELANKMMETIVGVQGRVLGVGADQYDEGDNQQFELMSVPEVIQYAKEEVLDLIAYGVMLHIKITKFEDAFNSTFAGYAKNRAAKHAASTTANYNPPA